MTHNNIINGVGNSLVGHIWLEGEFVIWPDAIGRIKSPFGTFRKLGLATLLGLAMPMIMKPAPKLAKSKFRSGPGHNAAEPPVDAFDLHEMP